MRCVRVRTVVDTSDAALRSEWPSPLSCTFKSNYLEWNLLHIIYQVCSQLVNLIIRLSPCIGNILKMFSPRLAIMATPGVVVLNRLSSLALPLTYVNSFPPV